MDYDTQKRTLKDSALWYREVIRTRGANLFSPAVSGPAGAPAAPALSADLVTA